MITQELRIGNYFYAEKSSCLFDKGFNKVTFDTFNDIRFRNAINSMQPIELTEEILLKCGFEKNASSYSKMIINFIHIEINIEAELTWLKERTIIHIEYLHQLQNLYFALTNEELNIQL